MKFTVYSKRGCPYCTKIIKVLELSELDHKVYKLDEHFDADQFYSEFGRGSTFPQIVASTKEGFSNLGGCSEAIESLQEMELI